LYLVGYILEYLEIFVVDDDDDDDNNNSNKNKYSCTWNITHNTEKYCSVKLEA
jgi:hypothetical protein